MRVLIFGGRDFDDAPRMHYELIRFQETHGRIVTVIHGKASGADTWADYFARNVLRCGVWPFPAAWEDISAPGAVLKRRPGGALYNAAAGVVRNERMLVEGLPDWGIGFRGGNGTADMADRLIRAGKRIWNGGYL